MTDANTGNSMIPGNPGIVAQQLADGAQQVAPITPGAPPNIQPVQPAPAVETYDFWSGVEQRVDPTQLPAEPEAQPGQPVAPVVPITPGQAAAPLPEVPVATALTPEQHAAIIEAGAGAAPVAQPAAPVAQPVVGQDAVIESTIQQLMSTEYAMPKEVADKLVSSPEEVYPRLAATMHVRLATQIGQAVSSLLPGIVDKMVTAKIEANRLENDFFRIYPLLADPRFRPVVAQSIAMARQANPQATREQVMSDGASLAALKLRIQPQVQGAASQAVAPVVPLQPTQVPVQPLAPVAPVAPFQPAAGGGGALPNLPPVLENEFEVLAMDQNW